MEGTAQMIHISYDQMHELIDKGLAAQKYAWNNYEMLVARKSSYVLYGPHATFLGAASPCHVTRADARNVKTKTRRKKYTKYELDEFYNIIRITHVHQDGRIWGVNHLFEINGTTYSCCFAEDKKMFVDYRVEAFKLERGKALFYAQTGTNDVFCEFYEYPGNGKRLCTGYMYCRTCEKTLYRLDPNWDAPYGAPDSPVSVDCYEDTLLELDFSKYFMGEKEEKTD